MAKPGNVAEIIAANIAEEHNGAVFYETLAKHASSPALREFAVITAEAERNHERIFREMLEVLDPEFEADYQESDYDSYVKALLKERAFPSAEAAEKMAREAESDLAAVKIAIGLEEHALLLLGELRSQVRAKEEDLVILMIEEEQAHLTDLSAIGERLNEP